LPNLRFTRDKRGYETTSLVHAFRHHGRAHQRILYWFRTPPGVKVGRPALDEDAIRWIEEHNPDIQFNWQKILEAQPPAPQPADDGRNRRRREKPPRPAKDAGRRGSPSQNRQPRVPAQTVQAAPSPEPIQQQPIDIVPEGDIPPEPLVPMMDALEQITHPDAEELPAPAITPVHSVVGSEQLIRLRARYAELLARITERGGDAARIEQLRAQADALNPDTWVTEEEARAGVRDFEPRIRDLRASLGLRRRRRSRRGGRRRRRHGEPGNESAAPQSAAGSAVETSNLAGEPEEPADAEEPE
jgi:ribonuclease E